MFCLSVFLRRLLMPTFYQKCGFMRLARCPPPKKRFILSIILIIIFPMNGNIEGFWGFGVLGF
jgi:hypothetical protein